MQGEEVETMRLRYRVPLLRGGLSTLIFGAATVLAYHWLNDADPQDAAELLFVVWCGIALVILFSVLVLRDTIQPRYIELSSVGMIVPKAYLGQATFKWDEIDTITEEKAHRAHRSATYLIVQGKGGSIRINSFWLPDGMSLNDLRNKVTRRVEIATGRKLD